MTDRTISASANGGMPRVEADVIIVGGGGSGLAAAIETHDQGRTAILLEKHDQIGGSTGRSVGSITATNTPHQLRKGILDSPEDHYEDMALFCELSARLRNHPYNIPNNMELRRILVDNMPDTFRWLISHGVEFFGPLPEPPHRRLRMHNVVPNSRAYIFHLGRAARRRHVDIRTRVNVRKLVMENGACVGVIGDTPDGPIEFRARGGVVLTSGDFSGSPDMLAEYVSVGISTAQAVNPHNTGDGHRMAMDVGAQMATTWLYSSGVRFPPPPPKWIMNLPPYRLVARAMLLALEYLPEKLLRPYMMHFVTSVLVPSADLFRSGTILINKRGERFIDESINPAGNTTPSPVLANQPDQAGYLLLDAKIVEKFSKWPFAVSSAPGIAWAYMQDYRRSRKDIFHEARSVAALAQKIGVPAQTLEKTVADYNNSVQGAAGDRQPLDRGPFVAMGPVKVFINYSDSGLAVSSRHEVLDAAERPIPGLFAAGFVGMGGVLLEGHGHHLGWAFTSGRRAGRHAAHRVKSGTGEAAAS